MPRHCGLTPVFSISNGRDPHFRPFSSVAFVQLGTPIDPNRSLDAILCAIAQMRQNPRQGGNANGRDVQVASFGQRV
jgi:hypothetical protein